MALTELPAEQPATPCWSTDSQWVAYVLASRDPALALPPGWLFRAAEPIRRVDGPRRTLRLWASRPATGDHILLAESDQPLSSPAWSPDGSAIAYVRVVASGNWERTAVREVVIQDAPGRTRVLFREEFDLGALTSSDPITGASVAWSADGNLLAVPRLAPSGLDVLRVENGTRLKVIEGVDSPAWSRVGEDLAYFRRGDDGSAALVVLKGNLEVEQALLVIPNSQGIPGPFWSRDGRSILVASRSREEMRLPGRPEAVAVEPVRLLRVSLDGGEPKPLQDLLLQPVAAPDVLRTATFSMNVDETHLFFATNTDQQISQISWAQPERELIQVRFNPVESSVSLEALALEPAGRRLALRVGQAGIEGPVALCDPVTQELTPLVPDDAARAEWLSFLIGVTRGCLRAIPPVGGEGGIERATPLPAPFELGPDTLGISSLRRLARIARPLCERPSDAPPGSPALDDALAEARFVFDYLRLDARAEHYRDAAVSLAALERLATTPADRDRWLCLLAQVELGLGETTRARRILAYLRDASPHPLGRYEETPAGPVLTANLHPDSVWLELLDAATHPTGPSAADSTTAAPDRDGLDLEPRSSPRRPSPTTPASNPDGRIDDVQVIVVP